ncbi:type IX secretion system sortase PorU [Pedobacter arcticus]|uniref:type IX secretion system sortase PorU n=1 Tax=Pedobacter arcticus TaxID=752140 RepID=UPI0002FBEC18|nr:type IX secretion system sortase PorU [Pedobacter arcticus]
MNWPSDTVIFNSASIKISENYFPRFRPDFFGDLPSVFLKIPVNTVNNAVKVLIEESSKAVIGNNKASAKSIASDLQLNYYSATENRQTYMLVSFLPVYKEADGSLRKVNSFKLQVNPVKANATAPIYSARTYGGNSVLASGNWYKIAVKDEGVYKLDYSFLKKLGIDVDQINPKNIRLYGNGGFMLPQQNALARLDDLKENAIEVVGEADAKFDAGDYVVFYSPGNTRWTLNAQQTFEHQQNVYADSSYYFINVDKGAGKRVTQSTNPVQPTNYTSSSFDDYQLYEKDLYGLITAKMKSGREWFGEDFEFENSRDFNFDVAGLIPSAPLSVKTKMAIRSNANSSAKVTANNQTLYNLTATALPLNFETDFAKPAEAINSVTGISGNVAKININYGKVNSTSNAWLDYIELNYKRNYSAYNGYLRFRDKSSVANGNVAQFNLNNLSADARVWDVTNFTEAKSQKLNAAGANYNFITGTTDLKEFVAFEPSVLKIPEAIGKIPNQNLHGLSQADFLVVTAPPFFNEAKRLAEFRKTTQGLSYQVVTTDQVFNEFSSGKRDASAIRDFVKMFYDRAGANPALQPKYLLLFGKGSFDNRMLKFKDNSFVVTYQSENSLSPTASYTSDDYFGLLDDNEGAFTEDYTTNPGLLDIAIGRIPVKTLAEAKNVVDKLITYDGSLSFGDWRNQITIVADDEDNNLHLNQAEANAALITQNNQNFNIDKIYFDAFQQESAAGGTAYPKAKEAINQKINAGTVLINYTGHGGESGWAQERVLTLADINSWENKDNLAVIFTATCSFSRWDDPETVSGGELSLIRKDNGVASIFSTTRIVFSSYNFDLNQSFLKALFNPTNQNKRISFGQVFKEAKNNNVGGLNINSRNFTLLGDPTALFPIPINGITTTSLPDTLKAGGKATIKGFVNNANGQILNQFNGVIYPTIYDKPTTISTLGQDMGLNGSYVQNFDIQKNIIYKGKATVTNGAFSFDFIVPRDINLQVGKGKISYYANNQNLDATGFSTDVKVGTVASNTQNDKIGPSVRVYLNDEKFVSGGITNTNPILLVNLNDESGINTTGIGIGHDIVATLSSATMNDKSIILNQYYQSSLDSYQAGTVKYPLNGLVPGLYTIKVKAWDVFNNSAEQLIDFEVKASEKLALSHVLNYPNPFSNRTSFQFEHNYPNESLEVQVNIRTITGRLIKTINQSIYTTGNRVDNIFWDAKDDFGEKVARGIYVYELKVRSTTGGFVARKTEKLLIL